MKNENRDVEKKKQTKRKKFLLYTSESLTLTLNSL